MFAGEVSGLELGRGAIVGALLVAGAYLAGFAVLRRGAAAFCGLLLVAAAAGVMIAPLGLATGFSPRLEALLEGLFAAAALLYLSSAIREARVNAILGGLMFAGALSLAGLGVIHALAASGGTRLFDYAAVAVGLFGVVLAASQWRRDLAARLILPGLLIALAAPLAQAMFGATAPLLPEALFTVGVIGASLVALTESAVPRALGHVHEDASSVIARHEAHQHAEMLRVSENKLAEVLDYSGVSIWDWCPHGAHQTEGFPVLLGADSNALFSPESLRAFIHRDDVGKYETKVLGAGGGANAGFDVVLKLHDGRRVRFRGARAMSGGELERLVVFVESADGKVVRDSSPMRAVEPPPIATAPAVDGALASAFPEALANGEIAAAFQPIVSLQTGKVVGYEALARWRAEGRERAGAEALVAAAEACGLGGALAEFMLEAAAEHLARELKPGARNLFVALNVSYRQICEPEFPAAVKKAMREHALPPKSIVLELTETQAISDPKAAASVFRSLRDAGAALAFDDFGAGFSSLANLQKFSFDYLKIDKSFIETLSKGGDGLKIARAIAGLGRDLGLTVIAEGVETRELADLAKAAGCTLGQGYAFGVPKAERSAHGQPRLSERRIAAEMR